MLLCRFRKTVAIIIGDYMRDFSYHASHVLLSHFKG